ncbi:MAG TPA: glycosyltransferase family 39 protein [Candidatus Kapabacteria bacterium]|nr:glycosyltransferase family 39 protein [Candidatus Kapabacteria bacterium]
MSTGNSKRATAFWLSVALAAFTLTAIFVNPLRDNTLDDDWANALTVRHLLDTGTYALNDWAVTDMPFHAYLGAGASLVFGYSPAVLRLVTLFMALVGLVAFYKLAREHDMDGRQAGLLSCIWLASPLLLRSSYTFMTNVTFVSLLVLATWLYARGMRTRSLPVMIAASLAAAACILTRPFGIALAAGLVIVWFTDRELRRSLGLLAAGILLPLAASVQQIIAAAGGNSWGLQYARAAETAYLGATGHLAANVLWRPSVVILYLALFMLPLAIPAVREFLFSLRAGSQVSARERSIGLPIVLAVLLTAVILLGHIVLDTPRMMPYAGWSFEIIKRFKPIGRGLFSAGACIGAVLMLRGIIITRLGRGTWHAAPFAGRLLFATAAVMLLANICFFRFGDEYILTYIPFALITVGYFLRSWISRLTAVTAVSSLAVLLCAALWTRGIIAGEEAGWLLGEQVRRQGVPVEAVHGTLNWNCYNGLFNRYLAETNRAPATDLNGFFTWYHEHQLHSQYVVTASPNARSDTSWQRASFALYRDFLLQTQPVYLIRRVH